jgi:hypothetical protein
VRQPDFFIVGAPRCGTTALYTYLKEHPRIFIPETKEIHYFSEDVPGFRRATTLDEYLQLFEGAGDEHAAVGEASVFYLSSPTAIEKIREFDPRSRIVVMLRNPVDMLPSFHSQMFTTFNETVEEFSEAWKLQEVRRAGKQIPPICRAPRCLQYREIALLGEQMERLLAVFPRQQVYACLFDDFIRDTRGEYERLLAFLGVPSDGRTEFPRVNENRAMKSRSIGMLVDRPPKPLYVAKERIRSLIGPGRYSAIARAAAGVLTREAAKPVVSSDFKENLRAELRGDVQKLGRILDRDLSHWLRPR